MDALRGNKPTSDLWNAMADVEYFKIFKGPSSIVDSVAPTLASSNPADGATSVLTAANITLNFSEPIVKGTGSISIVPTGTPGSATVLDVASGSVGVSGSTLTINPPDDLLPNTAYHLLVGSSAVKDATGNAFTGISNATTLNFTTIQNPVLSSSSPSDNATSVEGNTNIVLTFSRSVTAVASKNLTIVNTSDSLDQRVIEATDPQVTISGAVVTINPSLDLKGESNYALLIEAGSFRDANSMPVSGISDLTTLNFSTAKTRFTVTLDASGGAGVPATLITNLSDGFVQLPSPTKANATFLGWYTALTAGSKIGDAGVSFSPEANTTIFAQWDHAYTVTFSPGTNATVSLTSVAYLQSTGAITLPTPIRADYVFEGWYSADSGGSKIGDAAASYSPSLDLTLFGRWSQASLAGIPQADRTLVNTAVIVNGVESINIFTIGSSSVSLTIPSGAFAQGVEVKIYSIANNNRAQTVLPNETDFVNSIVVAWLAPDTTVPVANSPLSLVINDPNIKAGAKVFSIIGDQSTLLATATQNGTVTIQFTTDPLIAIANPLATPPTPPGSGSAGGDTTPPSNPSPESPPAAQTPALLNKGEPIEVLSMSEVVLVGARLELITSATINGQELKFRSSESGTQITILLPMLAAGEATLVLNFSGGKLSQKLQVAQANLSKVNAGSFNQVVAIYAKGYEGQRLSAKVGDDWVVESSIKGGFIRITDPVNRIGKPLKIRIYIDRKLVRTIDLVTN
jgi:uncharacterized repeat protein (TIGR02543 family)